MYLLIFCLLFINYINVGGTNLPVEHMVVGSLHYSGKSNRAAWIHRNTKIENENKLNS